MRSIFTVRPRPGATPRASRRARPAAREIGAPRGRIARVVPGEHRGCELVEQALVGRGALRDLERGAEQVRLAAVPVELERRAQVLAAQLDAERAERERELLGRVVALLGIAQGERERRAPAQLDPHDELLARAAGERRLEREHRLSREPREAGGLGVVETDALEAHGRERHELDLGAPGGVDLDDERALGAGLADVVRREAARVPGGGLRAHRLALVHVSERPVGVAAVELLGRAGRIALARARRSVDLRVQHRDRGRAGRRAAAARRDWRPRPRWRGRSRRRGRAVAPSASVSSNDDGLVRQRERAARLRERRQRVARIVVAAGDDRRRCRPRSRARAARAHGAAQRARPRCARRDRRRSRAHARRARSRACRRARTPRARRRGRGLAHRRRGSRTGRRDGNPRCGRSAAWGSQTSPAVGRRRSA